MFPPDAPFRFLNLNVLLGLTGTPFDQPERWRGRPARDAFDLQLCLEGREEAATYKAYHSIDAELRRGPGPVGFALGERVTLEGGWPDYHLTYRQPEAELELDARLAARPGFHWWANLGDRYSHYTTFVDCELTWRWGARSGRTTLPALFDHGWGRTLLPLRVPLRVFRYEVLRLPDSGTVASLWTEGPGRIELESGGVSRPPGATTCHRIERYECTVHEWDVFENRAGAPRQVPRRWSGKLTGRGGRFDYEAVRRSPPRPVLGYAEQLGAAFATRRRRSAL